MSAIPQPQYYDQDQERIKKIMQELSKRGAIRNCPRCNTDGWITELVGINVSPLPVDPSRNILFGYYIPALTLTCSNCGCVFTHNLITLGLHK